MMARAVGRALATGLLAALAGAVCAAVIYAASPGLRVDFDTDLPSIVSGIYPVERDQAARLSFAWTGPEATLRLPGLDRRVDWTLAMRLRGGRAAPASNPSVDVLSDGVLLLTIPTAADFTEAQVVIPAHPLRREGAILTLRCSSTFVPGASDRRALGVMLDWLALSPNGSVLAPRRAIAGNAAASAVMGIAIALLGVTPGSAIGAGVLLGTGSAAVVTHGFGPYTQFPQVAVRLAFGIGAALVLLTAVAQRLRREPFRNTARFAAAFSAAAMFLKLLVLSHPDMPVGDALFHVHRFQMVLRGTLYFTSIAPGGYSFPYPPGLYLFASLFSSLARGISAQMMLLRIVVCGVDSMAAIALYYAASKSWNDRLAAAIAAALYLLVPLDFGIVGTANLTNAFAQSVAVLALAAIADRSVRMSSGSRVALLAMLLLSAYVSHTSTFALLAMTTMATAALFLLRGGPPLRSAAAAVLVATAIAGVVAVVGYYAHFLETYRTEFARLGRETTHASLDAGGRSISARALVVPYSLRVCFGLPLPLLAAAGAWRLYRRAAADRLTLTIAGSAIACALFLVIGILTPMDMRYYLAAMPAVALAAAAGAAEAWHAGRGWRAAAAALLAGCVWTGVAQWLETLG